MHTAMKERLGAYLNDHLAGAAAGVELADRIRSQSEGTPLGTFMKELVTEVRADKETLEDLMGRLGIQRNPAREAAGWVAEKLTRLRFAEQLTGSPDLSRLLELETLSLGVEGKKAMWQGLLTAKDADPVLAQFDFDRMITRAEQQLDGLEGQRQGAARRAFTS
jgi:hypothetical protein